MSSSTPPPAPPPGADEPPLGEAHVRRFLDTRNDLLVARADFGALFSAYLDHVRRWDREPDGLGQVLMRQGLGAAALHLSCRPPGETVGWTIHLHQPPTNLFLTGDSSEGAVTGRLFTQGVNTDDPGSRVFVQSTRLGGAPVQSVVEVTGVDVLVIFEQFYERSEQTTARFLEVTDHEYVMLLALPEADDRWLLSLDRDQALGIAEDDLKELDARVFTFRCGCNPERMIDVMRDMFRDDENELFGADAGVEIACPRCGRRWWVDRARFRGDGPDADGPPPESRSSAD